MNGKVKCIQDEIPFEIPESWCWCRLYHIGNVLGGGTPSTSIKEYWHRGTINWFTPSFMSKINSRYVEETDIKISQEGLKHSSAKLFSDNSIIMSSRAPIGYLCINKTEACTSQGCKTIELYNKDILEFVFLAIKSNIDFLISIASGTTFKEISLKKFSDLLVPIPPLKEQISIVNKYYELLNLNENIQKEYADISKVRINLKSKILDTFFSSSSSYKSYYENDFNLGDILEYEQPAPYIVENTDYNDNFDTPVLTPGKTFILGYTNEKDGIYKADKDNKVIIFDDFTAASRLIDFNFKVKSSAMKILHISDKTKFDIDYMYYLLQTMNIIVDTHKRFWISEYAPLKVKIHKFEEQVKIKNRINSIFKTIDNL